MADEASSQQVSRAGIAIGEIIWERDGCFWREADTGDGVTRLHGFADDATVDHMLAWIGSLGASVGIDSIEPSSDGWCVSYWIGEYYGEAATASTLLEALSIAVRDLHEHGHSTASKEHD